MRQEEQVLFDALASVGSALGHGRRAELIDVLVQGERRVEDLAGRIGQMSGAVDVHVSELPGRLHHVPAGAQVVASCRGPCCVSSDDAVQALRAAVRDALRLVDGFPERAAAGLPVERLSA